MAFPTTQSPLNGAESGNNVLLRVYTAHVRAELKKKLMEEAEKLVEESLTDAMKGLNATIRVMQEAENHGFVVDVTTRLNGKVTP